MIYTKIGGVINVKPKHPISIKIKVVIILILLILPFNVLSLYTASTLKNNAITRLEYSVTSTLSSYMNLLDNKISNTNYFLYDIPENNADCIELLKQNDEWKYTYHRFQVFKTVSTDLSIANAADCMFFNMKAKNDFLAIYSKTATIINNNTIISSTTDNPTIYTKWYLTTFNDSPYLVRVINSTNAYYGAIINLQNTLLDLESAIQYKSMKVDFNSSPATEQKGLITCSVPSSNADLYLNITVSEKEILGSIEFWKRATEFIFIIYLFVIPALFLLFRHEVTHPLKALNNAHHELVLGNENYRISTPALSNEFQEAYHSFNHMANTLQQLRLDNMNKELAYKQLQLDNLQLQIRPHFLLNTLNLLYTLIQTHKSQLAQELILYLSNYFRYMFRNGRDLELFNKELDLIKEYLSISQIHYPNEFTVSYQIDPIITFLRIPPLLLHNFIENIIQHALVKGRIIHIVFYGGYEDGIVTFQISDDGRGMSEEDVFTINNAEITNPAGGHHIGIRNSMNRLNYYYGGQASVTVESSLNNGTTFTIRIPYYLEEQY